MIGSPSESKFRAYYADFLSALNARKVVRDLLRISLDPILLCWERPGEFCHRRLVAEWIESETGLFVPEAGTDRALFAASQRSIF